MKNMNLEIKQKEMKTINQKRAEAFIKVRLTITSCETEDQLESCLNMVKNYKKLFRNSPKGREDLMRRDEFIFSQDYDRMSSRIVKVNI